MPKQPSPEASARYHWITIAMCVAIAGGCTALASMGLVSLQFALALALLMLGTTGLSVFGLVRIRRSEAR